MENKKLSLDILQPPLQSWWRPTHTSSSGMSGDWSGLVSRLIYHCKSVSLLLKSLFQRIVNNLCIMLLWVCSCAAVRFLWTYWHVLSVLKVSCVLHHLPVYTLKPSCVFWQSGMLCPKSGLPLSDRTVLWLHLTIQFCWWMVLVPVAVISQ